MSDCYPNIIPCPLSKDPRFQDLTGRTFGRLTVIRHLGTDLKRQHHYWECECECGNIVAKASGPLTRGGTQSCGCYALLVRTKHGQYRTPEYHIYASARNRCTSPNNPYWHRYGGRGIEFRFVDFETFFAEIGPRPTPQHSLDRIDNNGHYEIGNVRWADAWTQQTNKSTSVPPIQYRGSTLTVPEIAQMTGISRRSIYQRIHNGWCAECICHPAKQGKTCQHKPINNSSS